MKSMVICVAINLPDDYWDPTTQKVSVKYQVTERVHLTQPNTENKWYENILTGKTCEGSLESGFENPDASHSILTEEDYFPRQEVLMRIELPMHRIVCTDCKGEGHVLNESMRHHAYSSEEFQEAFGDEMDELDYECHSDCEGDCKCPPPKLEYFKRGGIYDVPCPTCKTRNVIDVVDTETMESSDNPFWKAALVKINRDAAEEAEYRAICAAERRMGC